MRLWRFPELLIEDARYGACLWEWEYHLLCVDDGWLLLLHVHSLGKRGPASGRLPLTGYLGLEHRNHRLPL
jgi:hypothetical protein